jgi:hypothetical protein
MTGNSTVTYSGTAQAVGVVSEAAQVETTAAVAALLRQRVTARGTLTVTECAQVIEVKAVAAGVAQAVIVAHERLSAAFGAAATLLILTVALNCVDCVTVSL